MFSLYRRGIYASDEKKTVFRTDCPALLEVELVSQEESKVITELFRKFGEKGIQNDFVIPGHNSRSRVICLTKTIALTVDACTSMDFVQILPKDQSNGWTEETVMFKADVTKQEIEEIKSVSEIAVQTIREYFKDDDLLVTLEFGRLPDDQILLTGLVIEIEDDDGKIVRTISS